MADLSTREGLTAAQAEYQARRAADPAGFLRHRPDWGKDGFDFETGRVFEAVARATFGEFPEGEGDDKDSDLVILRAVHARAKSQWRDMIDTLQAVRDDDDPSLNADGRLKIAARILEPKLADVEALAAREISRVTEAIEHEEAEIAKAVRVADPIDIATHSDIRNYFRSLSGSKAVAEAHLAIQRGDLQTMQAIASAPPYMTGLVVNGEPHSAYLAVQAELRERMAPERTRRVAALRGGVLMVDRAVKEYTKRARSLIDFDRARQLIEREAQRAAR